MAGRRKDQPARSGSTLAGQQAQADEAPASDGPAGSMQASAGQQPAPEASNGPAAPAQPKRAAVPAGPFAQLLGPLQPVLSASPGAVLAAALLLHGAIAARDPSGPGSGHLLAWPLTASFLRALMMPASIQRLSTAARAYAGVAVAVKAALQRRREQQAQRQAQQQVQQQGPVPMQVERQAPRPYSRPPQPAQQPQPQPHGGLQGLVGAAKRKSSKPRSTQEALGVAGGGARHAGGGKDDAPKGGGRRRRKQPERLEVAIDAGPSYAPTQGRVSKRNGSAHRRSPSLADILLPPEPLPRWGRQRPRLDSRASPQPTLASFGADASLDLEGGGGLSALGSLAAKASDKDAERQALAAARQAGGPLVAENERLRRELRSMQLQRAGLESRLRQLQQVALAGGGGSGGRGRGGDVLERERLADAQAQVAVERRQLAAQRETFERERQEFRLIVESLAQTVLPPGTAAVVNAARQAMAATSTTPAPQPAARPPQQAQRVQPGAAGQPGGAVTFQVQQQGPALRPVQPVAVRGLPLPSRPTLRAQFGAQPPPPPPPSLPLALQGALQGLAARPPSAWPQPAARPMLVQSSGVPNGMPPPGSFAVAPQSQPAFTFHPGGLPPYQGQLMAAPAPAPPAAQPRPATGSSVAAAAQQLMEVLQRQQQQQLQNQPASAAQQQPLGTGGKLQELASQLLQNLMQRQQAPAQQAPQHHAPQQQAQASPAPPQQARPPGQPSQPPQVPSVDGNLLRMVQGLIAQGRLGPEQLRQAATLLGEMKQEGQGSGPPRLLQQAQQQAQQPVAPAQQQQQQQQQQPAGGSTTLLQYLNMAANQPAPPPPSPPQAQLPQPMPTAAQLVVPGATLPPALEAQLSLLPEQLREQMKKSLGRLCASIQSGQTNVQQLVSTLPLPAEAQQRVVAMLQQMVQPPRPSNGATQGTGAAQQAGAAGSAPAGGQVTGLLQKPALHQLGSGGAMQLGSGGLTPQVSPSAVAGMSAFAAAAQRPLSASPVLQKVTADDVAPVHKQLPPIRTSSLTLPDAARRAATQQQHAAGASAAAAARQQGQAAAPQQQAQPAGQQVRQQAQQPAAQPVQPALQPAQQPQPAAQQAAPAQPATQEAPVQPAQEVQPEQQAVAAPPAQEVQAEQAQPEQLAGAKRKAPEADAAAAPEALPNGGDAQQQGDTSPEQPAAKQPRTEGGGSAPAAGPGPSDGVAGAAS